MLKDFSSSLAEILIGVKANQWLAYLNFLTFLLLHANQNSLTSAPEDLQLSNI